MEVVNHKGGDKMNKTEKIAKILNDIFDEHHGEYVFSIFDSLQEQHSFCKALANELVQRGVKPN